MLIQPSLFLCRAQVGVLHNLEWLLQLNWPTLKATSQNGLNCCINIISKLKCDVFREVATSWWFGQI
jgi:hypothetical protein